MPEKMEAKPKSAPVHHGPFKPQLILHGGAGAYNRKLLTPDLYQRYHRSLMSHLTTTHALLTAEENPLSALDAACHAVSLMEDNPLFNCGRGSVFNIDGHIEMEASVAVTRIDIGDHDDDNKDTDTHEKGGNTRPPGSIKRSAAVSMVRNTRHPIYLARAVLLEADSDGGLGGTAEMHGHISGRGVEEWGWAEHGLERKSDDWFWTKYRWDEHRRGLGKMSAEDEKCAFTFTADEIKVASQGTVGCVVLDSWGNLAAATSTGGLTNKKPGRIGDTPTIGAGFFAETWMEKVVQQQQLTSAAALELLQAGVQDVLAGVHAVSKRSWIARCLMPEPAPARAATDSESPHQLIPEKSSAEQQHPSLVTQKKPAKKDLRRRAIAMSGTGNGDSFLRVAAARTTAAMCRFSGLSLADATTAVAGPGGELQQSAEDRWLQTGEGQGGIIAIEAICSADGKKCESNVVFDFNCGGMWRAWYDKGQPHVMIFRDEY